MKRDKWKLREERQCRTSITISEVSKKRVEEIRKALPFLKSYGAVIEYCIAHVHEEIMVRKARR